VEIILNRQAKCIFFCPLKFIDFYATRRFITLYTRARCFSWS